MAGDQIMPGDQMESRATACASAANAPDRRRFLGGALAFGALLVAPQAIWAQVRAGTTGGATTAQRRVLTVVCDLVIPATDTPGAVAAGVPAFVELGLGHGLENTLVAGTAAQPAGLQLLDWLQTELDRRADGIFLSATPARQTTALERLDTETYAQGQGDAPWRKLKALILDGYYTSEIGGSKELHYELVPGRFDPDLLLAADSRSWSSDWTAVDFG